MWCRTCRQDVLGIATAPPGPSRCVRCGTILAREGWSDPSPAQGIEKLAEHGVSLDAPPAPQTNQRPAIDTLGDDWDLAASVAKARRWAAMPTASPVSHAPSSSSHALHAAHAHIAAPHVPPPHVATAPAPHARPARASSSLLGFVAWLVLLNGLAALVCGAVLLVWSIVADRADLWDLGMPITLAGQAGLLAGLVLQLERLWHGSRRAADELAKVEERLMGVERAAEVLGATHGPSATSFYAHLADGAGPQVLLADLKGQLDLLATRLSDRRAG